jgi:hypothetical protein
VTRSSLRKLVLRYKRPKALARARAGIARHDLEVGAAAHRQGRSRDVAGRIGGQKDGGVSNIFWLTHAAQEDVFRYCLPLLVTDDSNHRGFNRPRRDRIYADAKAAHLVSQIARECDDSGLGCGVRNMRDGDVERGNRSDIDDRAVLADRGCDSIFEFSCGQPPADPRRRKSLGREVARDVVAVLSLSFPCVTGGKPIAILVDQASDEGTLFVACIVALDANSVLLKLKSLIRTSQ